MSHKLVVIAASLALGAMLAGCGAGVTARRASTATPGSPASGGYPAGAAMAPRELEQARLDEAPTAEKAGPAAPSTTASAPTPARGVANPNMWISNTYTPGQGERSRVEALIREGWLVDGRRIRLAAFPRTYSQGFPLPTRSALGLTAAAEHRRIHDSGGTVHLQVGIQAIKSESVRRPPLNVVLVMDRSGSMSAENKLPAARAAALALVDGLRPDDRAALVAFDDRAQVLVPSRRAGDAGRLRAAIAGIQPGGGTNVYEGLDLGYREARVGAGSDRISLVLLLSDGKVTAGVAEPTEFAGLVRGALEQGIQTSTVGMGLEFDEELMSLIARTGQGSYHFLRRPEEAASVLGAELEQLAQAVASALRLRIRLADGVGLVRVLGSRQLTGAEAAEVRRQERTLDRKVAEELGIVPDRARDDEPGIKMLIPHFFRGDRHVVILELSVPPGRGSRPLAEVTLKYKDLVFRRNETVGASALVRYTGDRAEAVGSLDRAVKKNLLGFQTGEALLQAADEIRAGRHAEAVRLLDDRMVVLGVAARQWGDRELDRDGRLLADYVEVVRAAGRRAHLADSGLGEYLAKSLTYNGDRLTR